MKITYISMIKSSQFTKDNEQKIKNHTLAVYTPCSGGRLEFCSLEETVIANSGTGNILTPCFEKAMGVSELIFFQGTVRDNYLSFSKDNFKSETNNPDNKGYEECDNKREIISKMKQIDIDNTGTSSLPHAGDINDFLPILGAGPKDIVYVADWHEATNACCYGKHFAFLLRKEHMDFINKKGHKAFRRYFFKKIKSTKIS